LLFNVPELDAQQAGLQSISIGQVGIGPINVGDLAIDNVDVTFSAGPVVLHNVVVTVTIEVTFEWDITIPMPWPFDDIHLGSTFDLGPFVFGPMPIGDVTIPSLTNVQLHLPSLAGQNMTATASPLSNLQVSNAVADTVVAHNITLPAAGFSLTGLMLTSVNGTAVGVPAVGVGDASIAHVHGDAVAIPQFTLGPVNVPTLSLPFATSTAPLDVPTVLSPMIIDIPAGLLHASVTLKVTAQSHVDQLDLNGAHASASVGQVVLHNVTLPYDVLNLTLSQVGINSVAIPSFAVS
jgi:hypothetical protein